MGYKGRCGWELFLDSYILKVIVILKGLLGLFYFISIKEFFFSEGMSWCCYIYLKGVVICYYFCYLGRSDR